MINSTLQHLAKEHACLLGLTAKINDCVASLELTENPDYEQLRGYLLALRRQFHDEHEAKERLLLKQLLPEQEPAKQLLDTFINSHGVEFERALSRLDAMLTAVLSDQMVSRELIRLEARRMLRHLRAQIDTEEQAALPWAETHLNAEEWAEFEALAARIPTSCQEPSYCHGEAE